jgi:hypothetical protein
MVAISNEALEWLDRAEQAREVAGQLTDPGAGRACGLGLRRPPEVKSPGARSYSPADQTQPLRVVRPTIPAFAPMR